MKILIIDLSNLIYRAFYATAPLSNGKIPTNAIHGSFKMFFNVINQFKPTNVVIAKDSKSETKYRKQIFPQYKANRKESPDELKVQVPLIEEIFQIMGIQVLENQDYEADDVIASICEKYKNEEKIIFSSDKDLCQLINENTIIYDGMKQKILKEADVKDKFGIYPNQIKDYLALVGDSSDNISGVTGIGPVAAKNLLIEFGSLESILQNVDRINKKTTQDKIKNGTNEAILSEKLTRLYIFPVESINNFQIKKTDLLKEMLTELKLESIKHLLYGVK